MATAVINENACPRGTRQLKFALKGETMRKLFLVLLFIAGVYLLAKGEVSTLSEAVGLGKAQALLPGLSWRELIGTFVFVVVLPLVILWGLRSSGEEGKWMS